MSFRTVSSWKKALFPVSILTCLLVGYVDFDIFELHRFFVFSPFFIAGAFCSEKKLDIQGIRIPMYVVIIFLIAIFATLYMGEYDIHDLLYGRPSYYDLDYTSNGMAYRLFHLIIAVASSIAFVTVVHPICGILSDIGQNTLYIYMFHRYIIMAFKKLCAHYGFVPDTLYILMFAFITFILLAWITKFKIIKKLCNPRSNYIIK